MEVIDINKRVFSKLNEFEVREDVIVPDVKPDIVNIIDSSGIVYAYKMERIDGKLKLDGNIEAYISYLSVDGGTRGIQTTISFVDSVEDRILTGEFIPKYNIEIVKVDSKVLNERKISLNYTLRISYEIFQKQQIEFCNDFSDIEGIQKQEKNVNINSLVGIGSSKASLKEDIKVDDIDSIAEILKVNILLSKSECKISYNKVLAKAEVNVSIMYLTEDDRISRVETSLPVMSFIEIPDVKEGNVCEVQYQIRNILIKNNNIESHSITCQIEFEIMCEVAETKQLNIVSDLYSLQSNVEFSSKEIEIDSLTNQKEGNSVKIDEKIEIEDLKRVLDVETKSKILKNTVSGENSNIEGEVELKIYYEVLSKSGLNVKIVNIPFITKTPKLEDVDISVVFKEFDSQDNNLIFRNELVLNDENNMKQRISVIENVEEKVMDNRDDSSMIVYFVKPNDSIWNIAKNFQVTMDSIVKVNNLDNPELIYPGDKLYIVR